MEAYEKTFMVKEDDLDDLNHVNNVRYVQWIQDISKEHWMAAASEEMRKGIVWVVMHHSITYKSAAKLGDVVKASTYIEKSQGAISVRIVEMYDVNTNQLLVNSRTKWCLLRADTLKPTRISENIRQFFSSTNGNNID